MHSMNCVYTRLQSDICGTSSEESLKTVIMCVLSQLISVVKIAKEIYDLKEDVRSFKAKSQSLAENVKVIISPVEVLKDKCPKKELERFRESSAGGSGDGTGSNLDENGVRIWIASLLKLQDCLEKIKSFLKKLSSKNWIAKAFGKRRIEDKFASFRTDLCTFVQTLTLSLQVDFKDYITEEMVKEQRDAFSTIKMLAQDVKDIKQDSENQGEIAQETNNIVKELRFQQQLNDPTGKEGHLKFADFKLDELHKGTYGPIFKAKHNFDDKTLIVKQFEDRGMSAIKELKEQCELWKTLNFSRFIVHLYGYTVDEIGHMYFVVEYMSNGTLRNVLKNQEKHPLSWDQKIELARDCARGLCAIHLGQPKTMLHRAITSNRFMVDENYRAKISDNGFVKSASKISKSNNALKSGDRGAVENDEINYLCPEETITDGNWRTVKSEIYKLGVIFYEIASRKMPFQAMKEADGNPPSKKEKFDFIKAGETEAPPEDTPGDFRGLIDCCRQTDPSERPSTYDVVCRLEEMCFPELDAPVDD